MHRSTHRGCLLSIFALAWAVGACGGPDAPPFVAMDDVGLALVDAGEVDPPLDAGALPDAGVSPDGGLEVPDAGGCLGGNCGDTWTIEDVDTEGWAAGTVALVFDSAGRAHVSYADTRTDRMRYALHDGDRWTLETVDEPGVGWHRSTPTAGR